MSRKALIELSSDDSSDDFAPGTKTDTVQVSVIAQRTRTAMRMESASNEKVVKTPKRHLPSSRVTTLESEEIELDPPPIMKGMKRMLGENSKKKEGERRAKKLKSNEEGGDSRKGSTKAKTKMERSEAPVISIGDFVDEEEEKKIRKKKMKAKAEKNGNKAEKLEVPILDIASLPDAGVEDFDDAFDDVVWEDAEPNPAPSDTTPAKPSVIKIQLDKKVIEKLSEEPEGNDKKKKPGKKRASTVPTPRLTKEEREFSIHIQQAHILSLLGSFFLSSADCDDALLQSLLLSIIPLIHIPTKKHMEDHNSFLKWVTGLTMWWSGTFTIVDSPSVTSNVVKPLEKLKTCINTRKTSPSEFVRLFVAALRALGFATRLVVNLHPVRYRPQQPQHAPNSTDTPIIIDNDSNEKTVKKEVSVKEHSEIRMKEKESVKSSTDTGKDTKAADSGEKPPRKKRKISENESKTDSSPKKTREVKEQEEGQKEKKSPSPKKGEKEKVKGKKGKAKVLSLDSDNEKDEDFERDSASESSNEESKGEDEKGVKSRGTKRKRSDVKKEKLEEALDAALPDAFELWVEVYSKKGKTWVPIDVLRKSINKAEEVIGNAKHIIPTTPRMSEAARNKRPAFVYTFAFEGSRNVRDVTPRYAERWSEVLNERWIEETWLTETLDKINTPLLWRDEELRAEDQEFLEKKENEPIPTTLSAFAKHHLYVLEKNFGKYQVIHPPDTKPVGFFKTLPVYLRKNLATLHTAERWLQEGMQIKAGEKPVKRMKKRLVGKKKSLIEQQMALTQNEDIDDEEFDVEGKEDLVSEYFGPWQVEPYQPGVAMNGMVPKNKYGNVWLYKPEMLPRGCRHVQLENLTKIARRLGLDCAPAMIGWEHGRYPRPVLSGFVVCEEDVEALTEAWHEDYRAQMEREEKARKELVINNWKRLYKAVLMRDQLETEHGPYKKEPEKKEKGKAPEKKEKDKDKEKESEKAMLKRSDSVGKHVHEFKVIDVDEKGGTVTRRCSCGLTLTSENLML